jgi:type III pantothenate kinase
LLLAIDVGNTHTVLGYIQGHKILNTWRVSTHPICTADEFRIKVQMMLSFSGIEWPKIQDIVVSSVVPAASRMIEAAFRGNHLHLIQSSWPFSFEIHASPPQRVGADRLVNAEAVVREYGFPSIIVDSGTATTICAISTSQEGKPAYLGGAIIPGIELAMESLARSTAQLFTIDLTPPEKAIGTNTTDALRSGLLLGYASMIDGMVKRFKEELGKEELPVIATGGISNLMRGLTRELTVFDGELTLKGIAYLYESFRQR